MRTRVLAKWGLSSFAFTLALFAADQTWQKKPPDQWTQDEVRLILNDSPWAKRVKVRYMDPAPARGGSRPAPGTWPSPGGGPMGIPGGQPRSQSPGGVRTGSDVLVRWQSASVVQEAFKRAGLHEPPASELTAENYLVAVVGMPDMGTGFDDPDDAQVQSRLRDGARLFVGNQRSLIPSRVRAALLDDGWTIVYVFPKSEVGPLGDEKVKLLARVGPAQFSAEFKTKEMEFNGKPDL